MKRPLLFAVFIAVLAVSLGAVAQAPRTDRQALEAIGQILVEQGIVRPTTTTTQATTTTTAQPTTTTQPPTTTTTQPPTTTTQPPPTTTAPTTTTTQPNDVPDTIPHPGINGRNGFLFGVTNRDTPELLWRAPYLHEVPYALESGWLAGDRVGYGCAYTFLQHLGKITHRVTFRAIPGFPNPYIQINDTYMNEGERYYDGSPTPPGTIQVAPLECPAVAESYETIQVPDERPNIVLWDGEAVELRDYRTITPAPGVTFDVVDEIHIPFTVHSSTSGDHTVYHRITVIAREDGVPIVVLYYDAIVVGASVTDES